MPDAFPVVAVVGMGHGLFELRTQGGSNGDMHTGEVLGGDRDQIARRCRRLRRNHTLSVPKSRRIIRLRWATYLSSAAAREISSRPAMVRSVNLPPLRTAIVESFFCKESCFSSGPMNRKKFSEAR